MDRKRTINVWPSDQSSDRYPTMQFGNLDPAILIAYQINRDWCGTT